MIATGLNVLESLLSIYMINYSSRSSMWLWVSGYAAINFIQNHPPETNPLDTTRTRQKPSPRDNRCVQKPSPRDKTGSQNPTPGT